MEAIIYLKFDGIRKGETDLRSQSPHIEVSEKVTNEMLDILDRSIKEWVAKYYTEYGIIKITICKKVENIDGIFNFVSYKRLSEYTIGETVKGAMELEVGDILVDSLKGRLRIHFGFIPDSETRLSIKNLGFKWSPIGAMWTREYKEEILKPLERVLKTAKEGMVRNVL